MIERRWDGDTRGGGIANGAAQVAEVEDLLAALALPGWVTEDPDEHLLPLLRRVCSAAGSAWQLDRALTDEDATYVVDLTWSRPEGSLRRLRADVFALIGEVAESTTHVRQVIKDAAIEYRVATGMVAGDGPFAGHGHLLRLRITGPRLPQLMEGSRRPSPSVIAPAD